MSSTNPPRDPSGAPESVVQDREAIELATKKCLEAYRLLSEKTVPADDDGLGKMILERVINVLLDALDDDVFETKLALGFPRMKQWYEEPVNKVCEIVVRAIRDPDSDGTKIRHAMTIALGKKYFTQQVFQYFCPPLGRDNVVTLVSKLVQDTNAANISVESTANPQADGMSDKFRTDSMSSKRQRQFYQNAKKTLKRLEKSEKGFKKLPLQTKLRKVYQTSEDKCSRSTEGFIKKFTRCQQKFSPKQTPSASTEGETNELPADTGDPSHVTTMNTEDGAAKSLVVLRQGRRERKMRWSDEEIGTLRKIMDSPEFRKRRTLSKRTKFTHARYQKLFPGRQRTEEAIRNQVKKLLSTISDDSDDVSEEESEEESEEDKEGTEREAARKTTEKAKKREQEEATRNKAAEAEEAVRIKANKPRDEVRAVQTKRQKITPGSPRNKRAEKEIPMDKSANACSDEIERSKSHQRVRRSERTTRASNPSYRVPDSDEDDVSEEEEESEEGSKEESDEKLINGTFRKNQTVYVRGVCGRFHGGGPDNKGGYKLETGFGCESFFPRRLKCGSFGAPIRWRGKVQGYDRKSDMYEVAVFGHEYLEHESGIGLFREVEIIKREELNEEELKKLKDLYVTHLKERKKMPYLKIWSTLTHPSMDESSQLTIIIMHRCLFRKKRRGTSQAHTFIVFVVCVTLCVTRTSSIPTSHSWSVKEGVERSRT